MVPSGEIKSLVEAVGDAVAFSPSFICPDTITSKVTNSFRAFESPVINNSLSPGAKTMAGGVLLGTSIPSTLVIK